MRKECKGQAYLVRYADDFVCCFQSKSEADKFYVDLKERLKKFNLEIAEDKTKIIPFGRYAEENAKKNGNGKPPPSIFWDLHITEVKAKEENFELNGRRGVRSLKQSSNSAKNG